MGKYMDYILKIKMNSIKKYLKIQYLYIFGLLS